MTSWKATAYTTPPATNQRSLPGPVTRLQKPSRALPLSAVFRMKEYTMTMYWTPCMSRWATA